MEKNKEKNYLKKQMSNHNRKNYNWIAKNLQYQIYKIINYNLNADNFMCNKEPFLKYKLRVVLQTNVCN